MSMKGFWQHLSSHISWKLQKTKSFAFYKWILTGVTVPPRRFGSQHLFISDQSSCEFIVFFCRFVWICTVGCFDSHLKHVYVTLKRICQFHVRGQTIMNVFFLCCVAIDLCLKSVALWCKKLPYSLWQYFRNVISLCRLTVFSVWPHYLSLCKLELYFWAQKRTTNLM